MEQRLCAVVLFLCCCLEVGELSSVKTALIDKYLARSACNALCNEALNEPSCQLGRSGTVPARY